MLLLRFFAILKIATQLAMLVASYFGCIFCTPVLRACNMNGKRYKHLAHCCLRDAAAGQNAAPRNVMQAGKQTVGVGNLHKAVDWRFYNGAGSFGISSLDFIL